MRFHFLAIFQGQTRRLIYCLIFDWLHLQLNYQEDTICLKIPFQDSGALPPTSAISQIGFNALDKCDNEIYSAFLGK
jgi:hypothetical protein